MNIEKIQQQLSREQLSLASVNKRGLAFFIDEVIISFLFAVIFWDKLTSFDSTEEVLDFSRTLLVYIMSVKVVYQALFVYYYGATLGKLAVSIRVVEVEYMRLPSITQSIIRAIVRVVSEMVFYIGFVIGMIHPIRLTWQDKAATTIIIND